MHLDVDVELQARGLALCRLRPGEVEEGWGRGLGRKFPRCAPAPTTIITTPRPASSFSSASRRNLEEVELEEAAAPELRRRESTSTVCTAVGGE